MTDPTTIEENPKNIIDCHNTILSKKVTTSTEIISSNKLYIAREQDVSDFIVRCTNVAKLRYALEHPEKCRNSTVNMKSESGARQLAEMLMDADRRGHYTHGIVRLENYLLELISGVNDGSNEVVPKVIKQKGGTAHVDGANCLGAVVGNFCAQLAIDLARKNGIAWVTARDSNHFGICAYYTLKIMRAGFIGMSYTNSSPIMFLTGASKPSIGSNPISIAAKGTRDEFVLDMATSNVAYGKIENSLKQNNGVIPPHWAADENGGITTSAQVALERGGLLPLGATGGAKNLVNENEDQNKNTKTYYPKDVSYKGSGLAMMIELFTSVLAGSPIGACVRMWRDFSGNDNADLGQTFVALDPDCFAEKFPERLQSFLDEIHNLPRIDSEVPVRVPGDLEREHSARCDTVGGLIYNTIIIDQMEQIARDYDVKIFRIFIVENATKKVQLPEHFFSESDPMDLKFLLSSPYTLLHSINLKLIDWIGAEL